MTTESGNSGAIVAAHPALPGHFPGNPVVPGVVILNRVCRALTRECSGAVKAIPAVKFHSPLRPAEPFDIQLARTGPGEYRFRVVSRGALVAAGAIQAWA